MPTSQHLKLLRALLLASKRFEFKNPEDDQPTIAVLDMGFGHPGAKPLFNKLRFSVGTHSRVAVVGQCHVGFALGIEPVLVAARGSKCVAHFCRSVTQVPSQIWLDTGFSLDDFCGVLLL